MRGKSITSARFITTAGSEENLHTVKVALLALVNAGASFTVKVKVCVPAAPTPLLTLRLIV